MQIIRPYRSKGGYSFGHFHATNDGNNTLCGMDIGRGEWWTFDNKYELTCEKCIRLRLKDADSKVKEVEDIVGLPHDCWNLVDPVQLMEACHKVMKQ